MMAVCLLSSSVIFHFSMFIFEPFMIYLACGCIATVF
jgi:hypothetical protein